MPRPPPRSCKHVRERVSPFKRIRRLEFAPLPKTISGKIRRVELRQLEEARGAGGHSGARRSSGKRTCVSEDSWFMMRS